VFATWALWKLVVVIRQVRIRVNKDSDIASERVEQEVVVA
jgi:hypothetical protein